MSIQLLHGDCLEIMKTLPDKSVDCFICDLPYGCLLSGGRASGGIKVLKNGEKTDKGKTITPCPWDVKIDLDKFWIQVKRLCKTDNTPIIMFCNTRFGIDLINSNPTWFRYDIVWNKNNGTNFLDVGKRPMTSHEMIYIFSKKGAYYKRIDKDGRCSLSVYTCMSKRARGGHPTEKPEELYKWLLERYCPPGGTVVDPTAGSFNSIAVAKKLGLHGIGIEMDDEFFKKAHTRFNHVITHE